MELVGDHQLYIGTNQGLLLEYSLPDIKLNSLLELRKAKELGAVRVEIKFFTIFFHYLALQKAPITFLRSASALDRLLALCDSTLLVLNAPDLSALPLNSKMRGVTACCVNENPLSGDPFSVQVCLAKKKQLAVVSISEQKMVVDKTRELSEPVRVVSMDGNYICAALSSHYIIFDVTTGVCQDLFPFEPESHPLVTRISKVREPFGTLLCNHF